MKIEITRAAADFADWEGLMQLLHAAFAFQDDRIDPPSSLHRLDAQSIASKADEETLILAFVDGSLAGCLFAKTTQAALYVGKMAVSPHLQGRGIGRRLMLAAEAHARQADRKVLELETRIELTENHEKFRALGFIKTAEHAHPGYDRMTSITMQKRLD